MTPPGISPRVIHLMRSLKGAPLSIFVCLMVLDQPLGRDMLVDITGYSRVNVTAALRLLETVGLARHDQRYNNWTFTGRYAMPLPSDFDGEFLKPAPLAALEAANADEPDDEDGAGEDNPDEEAILMLRAKNRTPPESLKDSDLVVKESFNFKKKVNSLTTDSDSVSPPGEEAPNVLAMLDASEALLGSRVLGGPEDYPDPWNLLSWMAYACSRRHKLRKPAGLVFWGVRQNHPPDDLDCEAHPENFLPDWFLREVGLIPAGEPDPEERLLPAEQALDEPLWGGPPPRRAWQQALGEIESEVPHADFTTWLAGVQPAGMAGGTLEVYACSPVHAEQIEKHLPRLGDLLSEGYGRSVRVRAVMR